MDKIKQIIQEEIARVLGEGSGTPKAIEGYVGELVKEFSELLSSIQQMEEGDNGSLREVYKVKSLDESLPIDTITLDISVAVHPGSGKIMIDGHAERGLGEKAGKINPVIKMDIATNKDISAEVFSDQLDDFLTHEMTHIYEFYNRQKTGAQTKGDFLNYITSMEMDKKYPKAWKSFLTMIYHTIDFEVNARVAQVGKMAQKLRKQGKSESEILNHIKAQEPWKIYEAWMDFTPGLIVSHIQAMINSDAKAKELGYTVDRIVNSYKKRIATTFDGKNMELKPSEIKFLNQTEKMGAMEFLEYWDKQFKKEAEAYKKRMLKAIGSE